MGAGQKTLRPIGAGPADVGVPRGLDAGDAVDLRARRRGQPVGDLGLHHHQPSLEARQQRAADAAAPAPTRCRAGWRPARSAAGPGRSSMRIASAATTSQRPASSGAYAASVVGQRGGQHRVDLDRHDPATPRRAAPVSATRAPDPPRRPRRRGRGRRSRTMRRTVLASITKFCPRCLVGRTSEPGRERTNVRRPEQCRAGGRHAVSLWGVSG